jgi:hypothetical protein
MGRGFCLLWALVVDIEPHHHVKILEHCAINQYRTLDRGEGWISDPALKVMDLHGLFKGLHIPLGQSSMAIVLIHMSITILVKRKIPLVTTVVQVLQGWKDVSNHGVDLVPPKEMVVEVTPGLTLILLASKLLDVLPCAWEAKTC